MSHTTTLSVTGMTCSHCEASVREELGELGGVTSVEADHGTGHVVVVSDGPLDDDAVRAAVEEAGYAVAEPGGPR